MVTLVKNTKTKTYFNFNGEIFKTSNQFADRNFERVDFSKLQKEQVDAINSPYNWREVGDFETLDLAYDEYVKSEIEIKSIKRAENDKMALEFRQRKEAEWNSIKDLPVIPTTIDNLRIVLQHLNDQNWGTWRLPKMEIGYAAHQYDCDGVSATTIKLDQPISDEYYNIKNETKFKVGGKRHHLNNYKSL